MMDPNFAGKSTAAPHLGRSDIDQMPETPNRGGRHRRAQSETFFHFPDDMLLDDVVGNFNLAALDIPSLSSDNDGNGAICNAPMGMAVDSSTGDEKFKDRWAGLNPHLRSFSVGEDFFAGLDLTSGGGCDSERSGGRPPAGSQQHRRHHSHSNSMDGSTSPFEAESSLMAMDGLRKAMAPDRLAELALIDPKRAKRIIANRQSAARSKERKIRYMNELERKVQTLQTEATTLSAQITVLQRDKTGLTAENKELKLRLQTMEQQSNLRDALQEALREEVQRLRIAASQLPAANGNTLNRGLPLQFSSQSHSQMFSSNNQPQHPQQQQQQQQQQLHCSQSATNNQSPSLQPRPSFFKSDQRV